MAYGQARAPLVPLCELVRIGRFAPSRVLSCNRSNDLTRRMRRGSPIPASGLGPSPTLPEPVVANAGAPAMASGICLWRLVP